MSSHFSPARGGSYLSPSQADSAHTPREPLDPSGPCARMGRKLSCCQLSARGDGLCRFGICLGCCQSLDAVSGWQHGHIACLGEQGRPRLAVASFPGAPDST